MIDTKALRQKILDMAIKGELVPQDPSDEPASILLEKIRAEKQQLIKEGKIKIDKADSVIFKGDDNRHYENLPNGWAICKLSDILFARTGATFSKGEAISQQSENYIRVLRGGNIEPYKITYKDDDLFISCEKVKDTIFLKQYDIITPAVTSLENIGKMACYMQPINEQITVGGFVYLFTPYFCDLACARFLLYQLTSPSFIKSLQNISKKSGAAFYNINKDKLNNLIFYLPPYKEQVRIVEFVDALLEQVELIDGNQLDIKTLYEVLKKKTLDLAIRGKLVPQDENDEPASELLKRIRAEKKAQLGKKYVDSYIYKGDDNYYYEHIDRKAKDEAIEVPFDLPDNWCYARIKTLVNLLTDGTHSTPKYTTNGIPFISVKDLSTGILSFESTKFISIEEHRELSKRCNPCKGDILLTKVGTTGIPVLVDTEKEFSLFVSVALLKFDSSYINSEFFIFLLKSPLVQEQAAENTRGVGNKNWVLSDINKTLVVLPPLAEQRRIVNKINEIFAKL